MRVLISLMAAVAVLVVMTASFALAAPADPFTGVYVSTDPADDSNQTLVFGGAGSSRHVTLFDDFATGACEPAAPVTLRGTGSVDGDDLTVTLTGRCAGGAPSGPFEGVVFTDNQDGTLSDNASGAEWRRP